MPKPVPTVDVAVSGIAQVSMSSPLGVLQLQAVPWADTWHFEHPQVGCQDAKKCLGFDIGNIDLPKNDQLLLQMQMGDSQNIGISTGP